MLFHVLRKLVHFLGSRSQRLARVFPDLGNDLVVEMSYKFRRFLFQSRRHFGDGLVQARRGFLDFSIEVVHEQSSTLVTREVARVAADTEHFIISLIKDWVNRCAGVWTLMR